MTTSVTLPQSASSVDTTPHWLKRHYFARFAFSAIWVALAVARNLPALTVVMVVGYPAWDAVANLVDAQRSGGIGRKRLLSNFVATYWLWKV